MGFWSSKSGIAANYSYSSSPTFMVEPWSVHTGRAKFSTSNTPTRVSVFIFDKKKFENYLLNYGIIHSKSSAGDRQLLSDSYDVLRNQVSNLAKLKHPTILTLMAPLEEHSKNFMFVTEYVSGSLFSIYQGYDGEQDLLSNNSQSVVIQRGILQISQALDFIHNKASSVHLELHPNSVFVNENSDWKVSGLGHLVKLPPSTNTAEYFMPQYDPRVPPFMNLNLDYTAPEVVFESTLSPKSDYFSLGALIYFLYYGKNLLNCENSSSYYQDEYRKFERKLVNMSWDNIFNRVSEKLRFVMPKLLNRDLYSRYDNITEFINSEIFDDPLVKTLLFLDELPTKSTEDLVTFLDGLSKLLPQFPTQLLQRKFLSALLELLDRCCSSNDINSKCLNLSLHISIQIGQSLSQLTFNEKVTPHLISTTNFGILLENAAVCFITNLEILKSKLKQEVFAEQLLKPLCSHVLKLSGDPAVVLQENLLAKLKVILEALGFATIKRYLFPLVSDLFVKTTSLTVKLSCIASFQEMLSTKTLDKFTFMDELVPLIKVMKTRDPRVLMKFMELFKTLPDLIQNDETIVEHILPLMWNFSMAKTLDPTQYSQYTEVINNISRKIQRSHLETLKKDTSKTKTSNSDDFANVINKPILPITQDNRDSMTGSNVPTLNPKKPSNINSSKSSNTYSSPIPTTSTAPKSNPKPLVLTRGITQSNRTRPTRGFPRKYTATNTTTTVPAPAANAPTAPPDDDFDVFVSPNSSSITSNAGSISRAPPAPAPNPSNLPPGFSMSLLQPNKRHSSTPPPGTAADNTEGLI